jgi:hypothetical protein
MAKQRYINTHFWDDTYIMKLRWDEKLVFIYLLTNPLTDITGIYELHSKRVAFDLDMEHKRVLEIFIKFEADKKAYYRNGWVAIVNFIKNQSLNPKIVAGIRSSLISKPTELRGLVNLCGLQERETPKRKQIYVAQRKRILERDGHKCQFCETTKDLEIDHINPVILGGDNSDDNLRALCQKCNGKRNAELRWTENGDVVSMGDGMGEGMGDPSQKMGEDVISNPAETEDLPMGSLSDLILYKDKEKKEEAPTPTVKTTKKKKVDLTKRTRPDLNNEDYLVHLAATYPVLEIQKIYQKMVDWCLRKKETPSRLRLLRWIDGELEAMPMEVAVVTETASNVVPIRSQEEKLKDFEAQALTPLKIHVC